MADMQERLDRLQDRASKRRQIAKDVMVELDLKKVTAPDFTVSIRPGMPSLLVLDELAVPSIYWQPVAPRLNRQELLSELKEGADIKGVTLSNTEPVLSVRTNNGFLSKTSAGAKAQSGKPPYPHARGAWS